MSQFDLSEKDSTSETVNHEMLTDHVSEDSDLTPAEKETQFRFTKGDDQLRVYSEEAGITRRLINHPEFEIENLRVTDGDAWGKRVAPHRFDGGTITGVEGYAPVGILKFAACSRSKSGHASVVSRAGGGDE